MTTTHDDEVTGWNEAMLQGALREHHGERAPDLTARILARTGHRDVEDQVAMPRRKSWLAAALVMLGAGAVFAVAFATRDLAPAQEPDKRFWPLDPGATWVFVVERNGATSEMTQRAMSTFAFQASTEKEPRIVCQLFVRDADEAGFDYLAADARGLYRYAGTRRFAGPGLDPEAPVTRLLALPTGIETQWETDETQWRDTDVVLGRGPGGGAVAGAGGGGAFGGGGGPPPKAAAMVGGRSKRAVEHKRVELVAPAVKVKVPAGEFTAAHVRLSLKGGEGDPQALAGRVEDLWLVPGTGIVRRSVEQGGKVIENAELKSFTAGTADPDAKAVLAKFLQRDAGITSLGPVQATEWVEPSARNLRLRSRFAVVSFVDKKVLFCVRGSTVAPFDPADAAQWTALVREEGMTGWNDGLLPQSRVTALVDLAVRTRAAQKGFQLDGKPALGWRFRGGPEGSNCNYSLPCTDAAGAAQKVTADMSIDLGDQVIKIEFPDQ